MVKKLLDANVVIRYLVDDDKKKAQKFRQLLQTTEFELWLPDTVVAEIVWVLESYYQISKVEIVEKLQALLALTSISANTTILLRAMGLFSQYNVDYVDAYLASLAMEDRLQVISYDHDFDKLPGLKRDEP